MKISDFKPKDQYCYSASNAKIEDKVYIIGSKTDMRTKDEIHIRFASTKLKKKPNNILFTVDNLFTGPFIVSPILHTNNGGSGYLRMAGVFPFSKMIKIAICNIPTWAMNDIFLSGKIEPGGCIKQGTEICAVTYSGHCTVVLKDGDMYNEIKSP